MQIRHGASQPSTTSWELVSPSWRLSGHVSHHIEWSMSLMSKGSRGTCIPPGISTFLLTTSRHTRTLKHLLATGACQVQSEEAYYGHLVLRLMGCLVLMYTSRVICKGRLTMEEILFSLKHYWRFVDSEVFELQALSWWVDEKAA